MYPWGGEVYPGILLGVPWWVYSLPTMPPTMPSQVPHDAHPLLLALRYGDGQMGCAGRRGSGLKTENNIGKRAMRRIETSLLP